MHKHERAPRVHELASTSVRAYLPRIFGALGVEVLIFPSRARPCLISDQNDQLWIHVCAVTTLCVGCFVAAAAAAAAAGAAA